MAIKKTIEIDVSTAQAVGGLDNLSKALEKVDSSAKGVEATFEEVYGDLKPLTARMGEAEDRLYELALAGQSASQEYKDLLASVGRYRQVQMQTDMVVDAAATTFDSKLGGALQGVTSAFAGVQGAMALTGGQSEELEAAILKVQGAMALAEGVRGIREGATSFKALGTSAKAALSGIRTGIAATGIGLLVVALGAVVAYWDDIKEAVSGVSDEQEALNAKVAENVTAEQQKFDSLSLQENSLKLQGKSEREILKMKVAQTDQMIKAAEIQIEQSIATTKAQTETAKRNQEILAGTLKFLSLPLTMILKTVDLVGKALGKDFGLEEKVFKGISSLVFDPKETQAEGDKVVAEQRKALAKLKSDRDGLQLSINNIDKQAAKDAADKRKGANDKAIELEKQKAEALERIRQGEIDTEAERRAEEIRKVQEEYKTLIAEATKYGKDTTALKEAQRTKEKELNDKFAAEDAEKKKEADEKAKADAQKKLDDDAKKAEEEKRIEEEKRNFKEQEYRTTYDNLQNILSVGGGKLNKVAKALAIADVIRTATKSVSETVSSIGIANAKAVAASPLTGGMPFVAVNTLKGALTIGSTIASSIKSIQAIKSDSSSASSVGSGGSGGGFGGGGGSAPAAAPSFNVVGNSGINQIAQTLGSQQPVQAYVVANNVTTAQSLDRNIIQNASLG
jgi:membrane protein involved in colicin uptake